MKVAVVGGGIVGVAIAHALLDQGCSVTILDPRGFAGGASGGNAGWIAHIDVLPLASPKAWRNVPRWLLDPLGPLAIRPAYLPQLLPWLGRFLLASRPARVAEATKILAAFQLRALPAWERRLAALGLSHHLRRSGLLSVWTDRKAFAAASGLLRFQGEIGIPVRPLGPDEVRDLEPALGQGIAAGALYESGCHVSDPRALTEALGGAALGRGAVLLPVAARAIEPAADAIGIATDRGSWPFDRAVIATGAWSKPFARALGDRVPLDTERGYNATLPRGALGLTRPVVFEGMGFVTTPLDTGDRVGGAVEFAGLDAAPNFARIGAILARLRPLLPDADLSGATRWMGFRPSLPDSLPVIGAASGDGRVLYAFGHGHYGLTQAAATADLVAAMIAGRSPATGPFSPRRFAAPWAKPAAG